MLILLLLFPLGVLTIKPCWIKNGSYTSSKVSELSETAVDKVLIPTGPPLNLSIKSS